MIALEVTPHEVKSSLKEPQKGVLIDVREPQEYAIARIEGAELIPMQSVPAQLQRLEAMADQGPLLIYCHHGARSLQVANWLRQQGIENVASMAGGIDRWSLEIDPNVPRY